MTEKELKQLLDSTYELEGLLTLALSRTGAPDRVHRLIESKAYAIADQAALAASPQQEGEDMAPDEAAEAVSAEFEMREDADEPEPESKSQPSASPIIMNETAPEPAPLPEPKKPMAKPTEMTRREEQPMTGIEEQPEATKRRKGLRNCFSLNDRFLFRRELFGGDDAEFNAAIDRLAGFNSLSEAEDYIYNELQFDPDSEAVKSYIGILENYYA